MDGNRIPRRAVVAGLSGLAVAPHAWPQRLTPVVATEVEEGRDPLASRMDSEGRPTAQVFLNDLGPFHFLVDTGATMTVISADLAQRLGATLDGVVEVAGTTGLSQMPVTTVEKIAVGRIRKQGLRAAVFEGPAFAWGDGVLGANVFARRRLFFDFHSGRVVVEPSNSVRHMYDRPNLRLRNGVIADLSARVGSIDIRMVLDTGAVCTVANPVLADLLARRYRRASDREEVNVFGLNGEMIRGYPVALPKLGFGGVKINGAKALAADAPVFDIWGLKNEPSLILGVDLLAHLGQFSIDYETRMFEMRSVSLNFDRSGEVRI
jgi:predicted aspartyl protease